jgi:hypothetical protein
VDDLLSNPAVQAGLLPFAVALILVVVILYRSPSR